jgi:Protein of unknown function (DUF630)
MSCTISKKEDQTTVEHCRNRCHFIREAIYYRYIMADAHAEYGLALRSLASSLHAFLRPAVSHDPPVLSSRSMPSGRSHIQFDSASSESSHVRHSDSSSTNQSTITSHHWFPQNTIPSHRQSTLSRIQKAQDHYHNCRITTLPHTSTQNKIPILSLIHL